MADEFNLVNCPPMFCHRQQMDAVFAFQNRHKIMATCHAINVVTQLGGREFPPTFVYCETTDGELSKTLDRFIARTNELDGIVVRLVGQTL